VVAGYFVLDVAGDEHVGDLGYAAGDGLGAAIVPTLLVREGDVGAFARSDAVAARLRAFGVEPVRGDVADSTVLHDGASRVPSQLLRAQPNGMYQETSG
jgi:hypothetical protein